MKFIICVNAMPRLTVLLFIKMLTSHLLLPTILAQMQLPSVACPAYFEYQSTRDGYSGMITLPTQLAYAGTLQLNLSFSQRGLADVDAYPCIIPLTSEHQFNADILTLTSDRIRFQVQFPRPHAPPKLTRISVNGEVICQGTSYPPPSSWSETMYQISTRKFTQPNFYIGPLPERTENKSITVKTPLQTIRILPTPAAPAVPASTHTSSNDASACGAAGAAVVRPFMFGGSETVRGEFPWATPIYKNQIGDLNFICSGTLISLRAVITAAHCLELLNAAEILVFLGRHNLDSYSENGVMPRDIEKLIPHPDYRMGRPDADIAILQMQKLESFSQYIQPICLWGDTSTDVNAIVGKSGTIIGWGSNENGLKLTPIPKMLHVNIVSEADCMHSTSTFVTLISNRTLCAGNRDGTGPCLGDSGSSLMMYESGRWMLRGIVSHGRTKNQQCDLNEYVLYCDVAKHLTWLQQNS